MACHDAKSGELPLAFPDSLGAIATSAARDTIKGFLVLIGRLLKLTGGVGREICGPEAKQVCQYRMAFPGLTGSFAKILSKIDEMIVFVGESKSDKDKKKEYCMLALDMDEHEKRALDKAIEEHLYTARGSCPSRLISAASGCFSPVSSTEDRVQTATALPTDSTISTSPASVATREPYSYMMGDDSDCDGGLLAERSLEGSPRSAGYVGGLEDMFSFDPALVDTAPNEGSGVEKLTDMIEKLTDMIEMFEGV